MNKSILTFIVLMALSFSSFAGNSVEVSCQLTPAGSFSITSDKLVGKLYREGDLLKSKVMSVSVKSLKTGIDLRDKHLKKELKAKKIKMRNIVINGSKGVGELSLNKVKKRIEFLVKTVKDGYLATFKLKQSDFNIKPASFMGVGVQDELNIKVNLDRE